MPPEPDSTLLALIREYVNTPHRKVLLCAQDVADGLAAGSETRPASPESSWVFPESSWVFPPPAVPLMSIEVTVSPDVPPGYWKVTRHDKCMVRYKSRTVSHADCTVLGEHEPSPR